MIGICNENGRFNAVMENRWEHGPKTFPIESVPSHWKQKSLKLLEEKWKKPYSKKNT